MEASKDYYKRTRKVGEGTYGVVYHAKDTRDGKVRNPAAARRPLLGALTSAGSCD